MLTLASAVLACSVAGQRRSWGWCRRVLPTRPTTSANTRSTGLSPGGYFLSAALGSLTLEVSAGRTGYAPTCYPGQPVITEAQRATLAVGQELPEIDFAHALERRRARATSVSIEEGTSKSIELTLSR